MKTRGDQKTRQTPFLYEESKGKERDKGKSHSTEGDDSADCARNNRESQGVNQREGRTRGRESSKSSTRDGTCNKVKALEGGKQPPVSSSPQRKGKKKTQLQK